MKKILIFLLALTFIFFVGSSSVAIADDLQDGVNAIERKDYKTAHKLFLTLAEQGDTTAQSFLGSLYNEGLGVPQDYKEAVKLIFSISVDS